uniref:Putative depressant toxin Tx580 n=1 Tax=Buthus israelis TaxID=2899555 RepID=B8XH17_BUTIS|nr:putative depressant toxin Tx580 [Buthus occitanus israelis]
MKAALLLVFFSLILTGVLTKKSGYPIQKDGCKFWCIANHFCERYCKYKGGSGYCYKWKIACWCDDLPDWVPTWSYETNTCGGK